jgi:hypothetical protein
MDKFKFALGQSVTLKLSGEQGEIIGRAEYLVNPEPQYWVRYKAADGCQREIWWAESALR